MAKHFTPKYRVETRENATAMTPAAWKGRPTAARLADWVERYNESYKPGGVNFHVSKAHNVLIYTYYARIVEQATGRVVCEYRAPAFQVI